MSKKFLVAMLVVLVAMGAVFAGGASDKASLEPVVDTTDLSHDELVAAAQKEGSLVVYGVHSYIEHACRAFEEKYGIDVQWTQLGETEMISKITLFSLRMVPESGVRWLTRVISITGHRSALVP